MDPFKYQKLAQRTECNQEAARKRANARELFIRMNHAALGLCGDAGEVAAAIERWIYYGRELDRLNVVEELGDCLWYIAQMCNALDIDMGNVMATNIGKLKKRYPEKFDESQAMEENRNREEEMHAVANELETVRVELTEDTDLETADTSRNVECETCGVDERCTSGDGVTKTVKQLCSGHICPHCSTPISDEVIKRLYAGDRMKAGCPACRGQFVLAVRSRLSATITLEKLDAEASEEK